ncbi:MAG: DUF2179 domain-containing protein [Bacteroidales bacterium]|nr:DUF2179 domain-containing protein [Bacteroidales bacterium]
MEFLDQPFFEFMLIPLFIFVLRICDVTLDTMRIIFVSKGYKLIAPVIGFFEVLIWVIAISRIFENLNNWYCYIAYAAGFAMGNFVGMLLDEKLAIGHELIRIITRVDALDLISTLRHEGFGVTSVKATGMQGEVGILYVIINRKRLKHVVDLIQQYNPKAFFTIEDINFVNKSADPFYITTSKRRNFFSLVRR